MLECDICNFILRSLSVLWMQGFIKLQQILFLRLVNTLSLIFRFGVLSAIPLPLFLYI